MPSRLTTRVRRHVGGSPLLQVALFIVITVVVLLVAKYSGIVAA